MAEYGGAISLAQTRDTSHASEDEEVEQGPQSMSLLVVGGARSRSRASGGNGGGGGSSDMGEVVKKTRGRPPGSKNRPKPPIVITQDSEGGLRPAVLEIRAGCDVVKQLLDYARRHGVGLTVLSAAGTVSDVTLRHPMGHAPAMTVPGPHQIMGLSGTWLGSISHLSSPSPSPSPSPSFSVYLAGSQGQVYGGVVAGKLTAQTPVTVVAAAFCNPSFHRLPEEQRDGEKGDVEEANPKRTATVVCDSGVCSGGGSVMAPPQRVYSVGGPAAGSLNGQISVDLLHWGPGPVVRRLPYQ